MAPIWNDPNPVLVTKIDDLQIFSALDNSFITAFEAAPETHSHVFFEVLTALDGEFSVELLGGDSLLIKPDCLCLIPPGVYHYTKNVSESACKLAVRFSYSCVSDTGSSKASTVFATCRDTLENYRVARVVSGCEQLCQIIQTIARERSAQSFAADTYVDTLFTQFYIQLIRMLREQGETETSKAPVSLIAIEQDTRRVKIENYFLLHYQENITEEDLAAEMNLSKRQMSRVLQRTYGKSFRQLLIETRMHRAIQLLQEGAHSIEEIVYLTGYTSLSGFYSAFGKYFGVPVGKYSATYDLKNPKSDTL